MVRQRVLVFLLLCVSVWSGWVESGRNLSPSPSPSKASAPAPALAPAPAPAPALAATSRHKLKRIHGIMAALSFGILLPSFYLLTRFLTLLHFPFSKRQRTFIAIISILIGLTELTAWILGLDSFGKSWLDDGFFATIKSSHYASSLPHFVISIIIAVFWLGDSTPADCCVVQCDLPECDGIGETLGGIPLLSLCIAQTLIGIHMMPPPHAWKIAYIVFASVAGSLTLLLIAFSIFILANGGSLNPDSDSD